MVMLVPANARECARIAECLGNVQRAQHTLGVAFTMFCAAHEVPDGAALVQITPDGIEVQVPEQAAQDDRQLQVVP